MRLLQRERRADIADRHIENAIVIDIAEIYAHALERVMADDH